MAENSRVKMYSYSNASESSKLLSEALGIRKLSHTRSTFVPKKGDVILNWGYAGDLSRYAVCTIINKPSSVNLVANKLNFFNLAADDKISYKIPAYTTDIDVARGWLSDGRIVVVRHELRGNSGEGIEIIEPGDTLPSAGLYTMYIPKKEEYRVHVLGGKVIDVQRKILDKTKATVAVNKSTWFVRNHQSGFIFVRNDVKCPDKLLDYAVEAVESTGLDFGAVDIIYNQRRDEGYVLEINTAPGLSGETTLKNYASNLSEYIKSLRQ